MKKQDISPEKRRNIWIIRIASMIALPIIFHYVGLWIWDCNSFVELWDKTKHDSDNNSALTGMLFFTWYVLFPAFIVLIICVCTDMSDKKTWDDVFEQFEKEYKGQYKVDVVLQKWLKDNYDLPSEKQQSNNSGMATGILIGMTTGRI